MNNYCIHLKKRKNKPYCKIRNNQISFSECKECKEKEYKNYIDRKKSGFRSKSSLLTGQINKNAQSLTKKPVKKAKMHNKSKKLTKLERNRASVFTSDLEHCYLCGKPREHLHEIIYGKNRINSIKYNFVIPLCANHHTGKDGIHFNKDLDLYYKRLCQIHFENNIGNRIEFIKIFGRSYL